MRFSAFLGLLLVPACFIGEDELPKTNTTESPVIGGAAAPAGKWPDTVAVMWGGEQGCTGTLIAPTVVVTAGHCVEGGAPDQVMVGASALSRPSEGEIINVMRAYEYPDSWNTVDAGILVLAQPSKFAPRAVASGWVKFDIKNDAQVQFVGFGTTDRNGSVSTDSLMEATSTITDFNCSTQPGCNPAAQPDGELGAGGNGIDTCPGDSGGPAYLLTEYGAYLAGITSRAYDNANYACSEGGIYGRADKIVDWIESMATVKVSRGPVPTAESITTVRGTGGETQIVHNDPKPNTEHVYEITTPPAYGKAAVRADGLARVCPKRDVAGDDAMIVTVADKADPTRKLNVRVPIIIMDGEPADECDETDFGGDGGCCDTRRSATGSLPLGFAVLLVLRRRRK